MGEYYGVRMKDDPNGEYLQHWGVPKGFMREGHKYLARLVTPSGYRYLYTQAQVAAAKAGRAIGNAIGLNQRSRAQQATARAQRISGGNKGREQSVQGIKRARMAKATAKRAQSAYDKTLLGRAEKAFNSARKGVSDAANNAGKQANKMYKAVKNAPANADKALRNAIGNTAIMKRIDRAQRARKLNEQAKNQKSEFLKRAAANRRANGGLAEDHTNSLDDRKRYGRSATAEDMAQNKAWRNLNRNPSDNAPWRKIDAAERQKTVKANARRYAKPINPDTPRPSMTDARIGRMRRATAKRAEEAANRAVRRVDNATQAYRYTPLGKSEERIYKATGTNTLRDSYDRYEKTQYKKKKKRR